MKTVNFNAGRLIGWVLLCASPIAHAELYKWTDANGRTHYSERKEDAGKAKAVELKIGSRPPSPSVDRNSQEYWQDQERLFKQRQIERTNENPLGPTVVRKPKALSDGTPGETDLSRCNFARDIISGGLRHSNGAPTDDYDRKIAQNDIRTYCR